MMIDSVSLHSSHSLEALAHIVLAQFCLVFSLIYVLERSILWKWWNIGANRADLT